MTQPLDTLHHTAIQVKNIAEAVAWYREQFRCDVAYQDESWAMLDFANTSLALVLAEQHPYHFAILRDDVSGYGEPVAHRDGTRSVYIRDVDGNHVEMLELPDEANAPQ